MATPPTSRHFRTTQHYRQRRILPCDPTYLRAQYLSENWGPLSMHFGPDIPPDDAVEPDLDGDTPFICELQISPTCACNRSFRDRRALLAHQRHSQSPNHGITRILHQITLDNKCIVCGTNFRNAFEAAQHLTRSWHSGRCLQFFTHTLYDYLPTRPPPVLPHLLKRR